VDHAHEPRPDLQEFVDDERLDDLLQVVSLEGIAAAWRCYTARSAAGEYVDFDDPDWWAVEFWLSGGLAYQRDETAREGLLALVRAVPDELLEDVGAGPLENFIRADEEVVSWIVSEARANGRFRQVLRFVCLAAEQEWVRERLTAALGDDAGSGHE
jgi:hypothetical protein